MTPCPSPRGTCRRIGYPSHGLLVAIAWFVSVSWVVGAEPVRPSHPRFVHVRSPVSDAFSGEVQAAVESIPPAVWQLIDRAGWRLEAAEYVVDVVPSLKGVAPRGWPDGWRWENTDAVHLPSAKLLVIAEKRRTRKGNIVPCSRIAGVVRHEVGHAFDIMSGRPDRYDSMSRKFQAAYAADTSRLDKERRSRLRYYLQSGAAGRQETFAEAFAVVYGGGSDVEHQQAFESSFRDTIESVRQLVSHRIGTIVQRSAKPAPRK